MISYNERRAYDLRCQAAAIEARDRTVNVNLSESAAWLLRDFIGLLNLPKDVGLRDDMLVLNNALGYRPANPADGLPEPHVSGWSSKTILGLPR